MEDAYRALRAATQGLRGPTLPEELTRAVREGNDPDTKMLLVNLLTEGATTDTNWRRAIVYDHLKAMFVDPKSSVTERRYVVAIVGSRFPFSIKADFLEYIDRHWSREDSHPDLTRAIDAFEAAARASIQNEHSF